MIVCPVEGCVLFSGCPVSSCMWHAGANRCRHGITDSSEAGGPQVNEEEFSQTRTRILHYVTVGSFLEAHANKELSSLTNADFPSKDSFTAWCKLHSVKNYKDIPYQDIREHIKREL